MIVCVCYSLLVIVVCIPYYSVISYWLFTKWYSVLIIPDYMAIIHPINSYYPVGIIPIVSFLYIPNNRPLVYIPSIPTVPSFILILDSLSSSPLWIQLLHILKFLAILIFKFLQWPLFVPQTWRWSFCTEKPRGRSRSNASCDWGLFVGLSGASHQRSGPVVVRWWSGGEWRLTDHWYVSINQPWISHP